VTLVVPKGIGSAALAELDAVPWGRLSFAYEYRQSPTLNYDVEATLRTLGTDPQSALYACWSNICHQGTTYEATAYAVPYLAAFAAGDIARRVRMEVMLLLCDIGLSSCFATENGSFSGAYGEGVDELIRDALVRTKPHFDIVATCDPSLADVIAAILEIATEPSTASFNALRAIHTSLEQLIADTPDLPHVTSTAPAATVRYRHAKFGEAILLRKQEKGLLLRFDDGTERVIVERFLTKLD
jgi:hypothetical protein